MGDYPSFLKELEKKNNCHIKVKGGEVGKPNCFNKNLIILKKALVNYFIEGKSIYDTINENQELIDYQIIKKRSSKTKYMDMTHNVLLNDKVLRLFPVTKDGMKILTDKLSNIPEVPEQAVLIKENILGMTIKDIPNFDINYYVKAFNDKVEAWTKGMSENDENSYDVDDDLSYEDDDE